MKCIMFVIMNINDFEIVRDSVENLEDAGPDLVDYCVRWVTKYKLPFQVVN